MEDIKDGKEEVLEKVVMERKCTVFGGGKCPNLRVVNVRILGVVNVLLANDSQSLVFGLLMLFCSNSPNRIVLSW